MDRTITWDHPQIKTWLRLGLAWLLLLVNRTGNLNALPFLSRDVRKPVFGVSDKIQNPDKIRHKSGCAALENG